MPGVASPAPRPCVQSHRETHVLAGDPGRNRARRTWRGRGAGSAGARAPASNESSRQLSGVPTAQGRSGGV